MSLGVSLIVDRIETRREDSDQGFPTRGGPKDWTSFGIWSLVFSKARTAVMAFLDEMIAKECRTLYT